MQVIKTNQFTPQKAWDALSIANMNDITVRLHWADKAYHWHVNNGEEVFAVLDGEVTMHCQVKGKTTSTLLKTGDIFYASIGTKHYAQPIGEARMLVIEQQGSI